MFICCLIYPRCHDEEIISVIHLSVVTKFGVYVCISRPLPRGEERTREKKTETQQAARKQIPRIDRGPMASSVTGNDLLNYK